MNKTVHMMGSQHKRAAAILCATALALPVLSACEDPLSAPARQPNLERESTAFLPLPPGATIMTAAPGGHPPPVAEEQQPLGSFAPGNFTPAQRVPDIIARGRLVVGVDESQNLLSFRNSVTGELEGFEVDLAREIAQDIFGTANKVEFRFVDGADRIGALESDRVDMVVRSMTITRDRQKEVEFSAPYYTAHTRILTVEGSGITSVADLAGKTVCVTESSTSRNVLTRTAPTADILIARSWADCLVALQQNQVHALLSDDVILSGLAAQDPFTRITGEPLDSTSYGVAVPNTPASTGLVRQVNSTLERIEADGTWWSMYKRWLGAYQDTAGPPKPFYREESPAALGFTSEPATEKPDADDTDKVG